jgi:hypothetical protein
MKNKRQKRVPGKKLLAKAGLAIKNEFYLEAAWTLSELFERKLTRFLEKTGSPKVNGTPVLAHLLFLSKKQSAAAGENAPLNTALLDKIRDWKNQRNDIFRDLPVSHVSKQRLERLALEGIRLYKELNKVVKTMLIPA